LEEKDLKSGGQEEARDDRGLFKLLADGDKRAFSEIMKKYRNRALNFAYRYLGDFAEAEDVAQDCFVKIYYNRKRFDASREFDPWFYQILANCCRDRIRKKSRFADFLERFKQEKELEAIPDENPGRPDTSLLARALQKLPPAKREIIALRFDEDLSYEEIGVALGISQGTVMSRLHRAKKDLETILKEMGVNLK
jgi:RNA polymerase sigma-70 factor (ECF subfamily)